MTLMTVLEQEPFILLYELCGELQYKLNIFKCFTQSTFLTDGMVQTQSLTKCSRNPEYAMAD